MQSSLSSSSSSSSSATSNCSLQSMSYNNNSLGGSAMTNHSMQKMNHANNHGQLDCSNNNSLMNQQASSLISNGSSKTNTLSLCHDRNNMFGTNPNPKTIFKTSTNPNANPNCMEYPDCEFLKEGQGECYNGDHVSSVNGSPTSWDKAEDPQMVSWSRPSPTAALCFCKDIEQEQEYFQQLLGSSSHGWTDEKHSSYLDSMEADFLKSLMFKGSEHAEPSDLDDSASSHQAKAAKEFKVCQNGRWRPMCVQAPYVNNIGSLKQLSVAVKNPWIKRFRASKRAYFPSLIMEDPLLEDANTRFNARQRE